MVTKKPQSTKYYGFKSPLTEIKKVFNFMNGSLQLKVQQDMGSVNIDSFTKGRNVWENRNS